jgi:hypothetical protein
MTHKERKPFRRRDAPGHIDPQYARELMEKARETRNEDDTPEAAKAFLSRARSCDSVAEEMGEAFIEAATSGEESEPDRHDEVAEEERGGPFVITRAEEEFADGTDDSNIEEATREPLPKTSRADP